jgi:hypothetical protein
MVTPFRTSCWANVVVEVENKSEKARNAKKIGRFFTLEMLLF